jgi:hypothetical protein
MSPRLKAGQRVRLAPGGPVFTVERVTFTAAYVRTEAARHVVLFDDDGNVKREFDARESGSLAISPTSFVEIVA